MGDYRVVSLDGSALPPQVVRFAMERLADAEQIARESPHLYEPTPGYPIGEWSALVKWWKHRFGKDELTGELYDYILVRLTWPIPNVLIDQVCAPEYQEMVQTRSFVAALPVRVDESGHDVEETPLMFCFASYALHLDGRAELTTGIDEREFQINQIRQATMQSVVVKTPNEAVNSLNATS